MQNNSIEELSSVFEIEAVQELWRTPDLTFTVVYPTHNTAAIKGLRGTFSLKYKKELEKLLYEKGFSKVIYERKLEDDSFIEHVVNLKERK